MARRPSVYSRSSWRTSTPSWPHRPSSNSNQRMAQITELTQQDKVMLQQLGAQSERDEITIDQLRAQVSLRRPRQAYEERPSKTALAPTFLTMCQPFPPTSRPLSGLLLSLEGNFADFQRVQPLHAPPLSRLRSCTTPLSPVPVPISRVTPGLIDPTPSITGECADTAAADPPDPACVRHTSLALSPFPWPSLAPCPPSSRAGGPPRAIKKNDHWKVIRSI